MPGAAPPAEDPRDHHTLHGRTHPHPVVHRRVETTRTSRGVIYNKGYRAAFRVHGPQQVYWAETIACALASELAETTLYLTIRVW